jgi:hypothetical protein
MFRKKEKVIKFIPAIGTDTNIYDPPVPASKLIPEWYKNQNKYVGGTKSYSQENGTINHTIKGCMPVFDVMTAGYIYTLPADVIFSKGENGNVNTLWSTNDLGMIQSHPQPQYDSYSIPDEYEQIGLKFINPWITQTPPGYSCLFIQPTFRDDLPFYVLPAIVDTDTHPINVNFPFFIRKDFEGMLPMGTPIMQIIPFKRDSWSHEIVLDHDINLHKLWKKAERKGSNRYKTFFRQKKEWK